MANRTPAGKGKAKGHITKQAERRVQLSRATAEVITAEAESQGKDLPLDLMIKHMRYYEAKAEEWEAEALLINPEASKYRTKRARFDAAKQRVEMMSLSVKFRALAQAASTDAAPYMHAKITSVDGKNAGKSGVTIILQGADARA